MEHYYESVVYKPQNSQPIHLPKGVYEACRFEDMHLSGFNFSGFRLVDCVFVNCDLSMALLGNTSLVDVVFEQCKLLGWKLSDCNPIGLAATFKDCTLQSASFYGCNFAKTNFIDCSLKAADFSDCNLESAVFNNCDFLDAMFDNTNLQKADLSTSYNYSIHPQKNKIQKAVFGLQQLSGLLHHYNIKIV